MAKTIVDELVTLFTLKTSDKSKKGLKKFNLGLKNIRKFSLIAGTALIAFGVAAFFASEKVAKSLDMQGRFATSLGVSTAALQELQFALKSVGGTAEGLNSALNTLNSILNVGMASGQFNLGLAQLGVTMKKSNGQFKNSAELLIDISEAMQRFNAQQQVALGEKVGLTLPVIRLLQKGPKQIEALMIQARRLGAIVPPEAAKNAMAFDNALLDLKTTLKGAGIVLVSVILPALTLIITAFDNVLIKALKATEAIKAFVKPLRELKNTPEKVIKKIGEFFAPPLLKVVRFITPKRGEKENILNKFKKPFVPSSTINKTGTFPTGIIKTPFIFRKQKQIASVIRQTSQKTSNVITNNNTININGARNPTIIADEIGKRLGLNEAAQTAGPGFNRPTVA